MIIPAPDVMCQNIGRRFRKLKDNRVLQSISELMPGKYLFLTSVIISLYASFNVIEKISTSDVLLYYTLPREPNQFHPNDLGGIFGFMIGDISTLSIIFRIMYLVLILWSSALITWWGRRITDKLKRLEFLGIVTVFMKMLMVTSIYNSSYFDINDLPFNMFLSLVITGTAATLARSVKLGWLPVVVVMTAAAQLVECRTILYLLPLLIFLCITAGGVAPRGANRLRIICAFSGITVIAVLTVTQIFSQNNNVDWAPIAGYIATYGESGMELEFATVDYFYKGSVFDLMPYNIRHFFSPKLFLIKSNAVLVFLSLGCAYFMGYLKRRKNDPNKQGVFAALKKVFTFTEENRNAKLPIALIALFLVYTDIITPNLGIVEFSVILIVAVSIYCIEKPKEYLGLNVERKHFWSCLTVFILLKLFTSILAMEGEQFSYMHYYVSYQSFGIIPRGLIGSIFYAVFGETITLDKLLVILWVVFSLMPVLFFLFLRRIWNSSDERSANTVIKPLLMLFIVSPAFSYWFSLNNIFKLDYFLLCITLLCLYIADKNKPFVWFIPLLAAVCMLIHTVFACTMFPILFIVLVYRALVNSEGHTARNITVMLLTLAAVASLFLYFTFIYTVPDELTVEKVMRTMLFRSSGSIKPDESFVELIWADKGNEHIAYFQSLIKPSQIINIGYIFICALPLTLMYFYALNHSAKAEAKVLPKLGYLAMALSAFVTFVPALTETDYGRWCGYFLLTIILSTVLLSKMQPDSKKWFDGISAPFFKRFFAAGLVIAACFPTFDAFIRELPFFGR
ncbi:MAG: hypothetical protein ACI4XA_05375 [Oscillospiraceae bacterium]